MAAYGINYKVIINLIKDNLRNRYSGGFPILKELLQNADDAKATEFHFGYLPENTINTKHPLLRDPALFFINNGKFEDKDQRSIEFFGLSNKVSNESAIGKFGMGMKSIFHLCEAFFYITTNKHNILNPWEEQGLDKLIDLKPLQERNKQWLDFTETDVKEIRKIFENILKTETYFILWIPLRRETHVKWNDVKLGTFLDEYLGDKPDAESLKFLKEKKTSQEITLILPNLLHIEKVYQWEYKDKSLIENENFTINFKQGDRLKFNKDNFANPHVKYKGTCSYSPNQCIEFVGNEYYSDKTEFNELSKKAAWPKAEDENGNEIKEKAYPHYSILFQRILSNKGKGFIRIQKAVFLPLTGTDSEDKQNTHGEYEYYITLHGYFFVDSGRKDIVTPEEIDSITSEDQIRKHWNYLLMKSISQKFLETLDGFIKNQNLKPDEITTLTKAIRDSKYYKEYQETICSKQSWICVIVVENGNLTQKWRLVDNNDLLLPINLVNNFDLNILKDAVPDIFTGKLDIFIHNIFYQGLSGIKNKLWEETYRKSTVKYLQKNGNKLDEDTIKTFISVLDPKELFSIDCDFPIWQDLVQCNTDALLVRDEWIKGEAVPKSDDYTKWYQKIEDLLKKENNDNLFKIANSLYKPERKNTIRLFNVFKAYSCSHKKEISASIEMIEEAYKNSLLFNYSTDKNLEERTVIARTLQECLKNDKVFVITREIAKLLSLQVSSCDHKVIAELFGEKSLELNDNLIARGKLLEKIDIDAKSIKGFRYLLHANKNHYGNTEETLWKKEYQGSKDSVWYRLFEATQDNTPWNIIPDDLINKVQQEKWESLKVKEIKKEGVISELGNENQFKKISWTEFSSDSNEILKSISDGSLWKIIPIHETIKGERIQISYNIFLYPEHDCEEEEFKFIYEHTTFIKRSKDHEHLKKQAEIKRFDLIERLLDLIKENKIEGKYFLGNLSISDLDDALPDYITLFQNQNDFSGWTLLEKIKKHYPLEKYKEVFKALQKEIFIESIIPILKYLAAKGNIKDQGNRISLYNAYLKLFAKEDGAKDQLTEIKLLNKKKEWKETKMLCWSDVMGLSEEHYLDTEQEDILYALKEYKSFSEADDRKIISGKFVDYVRHWDKYIEPEWIAAFFLLLGNDSDIKNALQDKFTKHSQTDLEKAFHWTTREWERYPRLTDKDFPEIRESHKFHLLLQKGKSKKVFSVDGSLTEANLIDISKISSLLSDITNPPELRPASFDGHFEFRLTLRYLSKNDLEKIDIAEVVYRTILEIYKKVYLQEDSLLDLKNLIENSSQRGIWDVQFYFQKHISFYLDQIGKSNFGEEIKDFLKKINRENEKVSEYKEKVTEYKEKGKNASEIKKIEESINDLNKELINCIISSEVNEKILLDIVRNKIQDYRYEPSSVPFELFQNADDATLELVLFSENNTDYPKKFVLEYTDNTLYFIHWGRKINDPLNPDNKEKGYHQDLKKMLIITSSGKNDLAKKETTGKFGLGFNSLFLITNEPKILSGKLCINIKAGFYPDNYNDVDHFLKNKIEQYNSMHQNQGTLIEASVNKDIKVDEILSRFQNYAGFLTIFAKKIRTIQCNGKSFKWEYEACVGADNIESGTMDYQSEKQLVLYFRYNEGGILFRLEKEKGFLAFDKNIPSFWVVNPTQEFTDVSFLVNGNFELDTGRVQLSSINHRNEDIAFKIGEQFKLSLEQFLMCSNEDFQKQFSIDEYNFWNSLLHVFDNIVKKKNHRSDLYDKLLKGYSDFVKTNKVIPTDLIAEYKTITHFDGIKYVLDHELEKYFDKIKNWDSFKQRVKPSTIVSEDTNKYLQYFVKERQSIINLNLFLLLQWVSEDTENCIDNKQSELLSEVINKEFLDSIKYKDAILSIIKDFKFLSKANSNEESKKLIIEHSSNINDRNLSEENCRAKFAPDDRVLSTVYGNAAIEFFLICRQRMDATIEEMKDWIFSIDKKNLDKKKSTIHYFIYGEYKLDLLRVLREKGFPDWIKKLTLGSPELENLTTEQKNELLFREFKTTDEIQRSQKNVETINQNDSDIGPNQFARINNPTQILNSIHDWWAVNEKQLLQEYIKRTYPNGKEPSLEESNYADWLILFVLGATHRFGRVRAEQNKGFIEKCMNEGWWNTFSNKDPINYPKDWMDVLEKFSDQKYDEEDYMHWMQLYPSIFRLSRWKNEYIPQFGNLQKEEDSFDLQTFIKSRSNPNNSGGGIDAPSLEKTLGMGACFVLREVVRICAIKKINLNPYCFTPVQRVRNIFERLGCSGLENSLSSSKIIYTFIKDKIGKDKAHFDHCFDIPFQIIAGDFDLQQKFFHQTIDISDELFEEDI